MSVFGVPGWLGPLDVVPDPVVLASDASFAADLEDVLPVLGGVRFIDFPMSHLPAIERQLI
jgi:hypothetical protein